MASANCALPKRDLGDARIVSATEVTTGVAARLLQVSQDTVTRLCQEGILRSRRVRRTGWHLIDYNSVIEYRNKILSC